MAVNASTRAADVAVLFHALSDPVRLGVVRLLTAGEHCVCDLTDALDVSQSRLSWHLKTLTDAGIISARPSGRWVYYSLNIERVRSAKAFLASVKLTRRSRAKPCDTR